MWFLLMILYLLFFSFMEKRFLYIDLGNSFNFSSLDCAISGIDYVAMLDGKTLLFSESNGKEIILTILFWKQWLWDSHVIVIEMKVSGGYHRRVSSVWCLKQILSELLWKYSPPKKTAIASKWSRGWTFEYLYFDTIYLISKYTTEIMDYIMEKTVTQSIRLNLFVVWWYIYI